VRERRRLMLADPPVLGGAARAGAGHGAGGGGAPVPMVERVRGLLGLVVVAVREERELAAFPVEREAAVLALALEQRGRRSGAELEDERAVAGAVARRDGVGEARAVARERVAPHVLDPALLARLEVADDERRALLLAPLAAPRPLPLARGGGACAVRLRLRRVLLLPELVGQPAARLRRQLEAAHVRDAHDPARA